MKTRKGEARKEKEEGSNIKQKKSWQDKAKQQTAKQRHRAGKQTRLGKAMTEEGEEGEGEGEGAGNTKQNKKRQDVTKQQTER